MTKEVKPQMSSVIKGIKRWSQSEIKWCFCLSYQFNFISVYFIPYLYVQHYLFLTSKVCHNKQPLCNLPFYCSRSKRHLQDWAFHWNQLILTTGTIDSLAKSKRPAWHNYKIFSWIMLLEPPAYLSGSSRLVKKIVSGTFSLICVAFEIIWGDTQGFLLQ